MAEEISLLGDLGLDDLVSFLDDLDHDDLKFLSSLPADVSFDLLLTMKQNPLELITEVEHNISNSDVPVQFRAVAHLLLEEVRRQLAIVKRACCVFLENRQQEMGDAFVQSLDASMKIGNLLRKIETLLTWGPDQIKAINSRDHEARTILAANDRRSASRAEFWRPYKQEFQCLVSEGMKRDRARIVIGDRIAEGGGETYSHKTLRKWLRLDGEAD